MRLRASGRVVVAALVFTALIASACGSDGKKASSPPTTPSPAKSTSGPIDPKTAFVPLTGYTYTDLPEAVEAEARNGLESDPEAKKYITGFAMRAVSKGGDGVAVVMAVALEPTIGALIGAVREAMAEGLAEGTGSTPEPFTLAGREVFFLDEVGGVPGIMWDQRSMVLAVIGSDRTELEAVATQLIEGNG